MRLRCTIALLAVCVGIGLRLPAAEPEEGKVDIDRLMAGWEKTIREQMDRDPELKTLAARYPFVLLYARRYNNTKGNYGRSAYSFIHASSDEKATGGSQQILYENGARDNSFEVGDSGEQNLVADLGAVDFIKDPDPRQVDINGDGQNTWVQDCKAVPGHVYLERVRDWEGHLFYVLFKVVAADEQQNRYMAFLWRRLSEPSGLKRPHPADPYPGHYQPPLPAEEKARLNERMTEWEAAVREKVSKDARLKALAAKHSLVLLHARRYSGPVYGRSAYSFIYATTELKKHHNDVQIEFDHGSTRPDFRVNMMYGQQNLVTDLGRVDFAKDADPLHVDIDGDGQQTWLAECCAAVEGHVYLERVKNVYGTRFYVQFLVVAVDPENRYMAFLWRRLPGGRVVEPPALSR